MSDSKKNQYGLIILGNSGVGKSFLANVLLDKDVFKHDFSARSVTHRTEFQEITIGNHCYAVFNVPGLIEADQTRVDINKREIDHAFKLRPNSLILYVFGQQNGRIRDEDVVAFNAINSAYPLKSKSLLFILNGLPASRPKNYEGEVTLMLQDIIQVPIREDRICFLNHIDKNSSAERQDLKNQLLSFVVELTPAEHIKSHDIHLRVDEVASLKKQIEEMTEAFQQNKIYFENEIREQQKRYDALIADRKDDRDFFQRIIERQGQEAGELRQVQTKLFSQMHDSQTTQLSEMQRQMETMQIEYQKRIEDMTTQTTEQAQMTRAALEASREAQNELYKKISEMNNRPTQVFIAKDDSDDDNSCFVGGTLVRMADGTDKPIETIQVGDFVLGADNQSHSVMFLDVEKLNKRYLYGINDFSPFFTSEHVFLTTDGTMVAMEPMTTEREEPSLRGLIKPLRSNLELQGLVENRSSTILIQQLTCIESDSSINVYNVVLESGHTYYANGFCVFDMFPNLARYPQMFKLLHLLWRNCATQIDAHFDDVITPGSIDRIRLEQLAKYTNSLMASSSPCAIILLGNSGVGKSFLANRLLDDDQAFESRFSARSVTHQTEWKNYVTANGLTQYIVGNIPGLVEANQKLIDENRIEIMKAFEQHPWAIVLFVFGHKNGRIPDEDIVAFTRINDAYEFPSKSLLIIVNGIPPNRPNIYEEKTKELLHELIHIDDNHIYFIEKATTDEDKTIIHRQLHEAIAKCEPAKHIKKHDIELLVDEISRLKREIHQRQNQLLAQEQKYFNRQKSEPTSDVYQERQQSQIVTHEQISELIEKNRQIEESIEAISDKNKLFMMQYDAQRRNSDHDAVNKSAQRWINDSEWIKSQVPNIQVPPNQVIYTPNGSRKREGTSYYITEIINPSDGHNSYNPNYSYQDDSLMYDCSYLDSQTTYYYHSNSAGDKSTHF